MQKYLIRCVLVKDGAIFDTKSFEGPTMKIAANHAKKFCDRTQEIDPLIQINFDLKFATWESMIMPNDLIMKLLA